MTTSKPNFDHSGNSHISKPLGRAIHFEFPARQKHAQERTDFHLLPELMHQLGFWPHLRDIAVYSEQNSLHANHGGNILDHA